MSNPDEPPRYNKRAVASSARQERSRRAIEALRAAQFWPQGDQWYSNELRVVAPPCDPLRKSNSEPPRCHLHAPVLQTPSKAKLPRHNAPVLWPQGAPMDAHRRVARHAAFTQLEEPGTGRNITGPSSGAPSPVPEELIACTSRSFRHHPRTHYGADNISEHATQQTVAVSVAAVRRFLPSRLRFSLSFHSGHSNGRASPRHPAHSAAGAQLEETGHRTSYQRTFLCRTFSRPRGTNRLSCASRSFRHRPRIVWLPPLPPELIPQPTALDAVHDDEEPKTNDKRGLMKYDLTVSNLHTALFVINVSYFFELDSLITK
uniref:Uncharacterized protein n=1 Tax=Steinernema glaseri TaxID=37863 RepID=A0A1I7Y7C0_9BILA